MPAGTYVIVARVQTWVTIDTSIQIAVDESYNKWTASVTGENNLTITSIVQISDTTNIEVSAAHNDVGGERTFISSFKAVRVR